MYVADYFIDIGPGPAARGGQVVAKARRKRLLNVKASLTGKYLSGTGQPYALSVSNSLRERT